MTDVYLSGYREVRLARNLRERHPTSCLFEITPTCNLRCHFCYVALDPYRGPYLGLEQIERVYDKLAGAGVLFLTLTGGEIFSRRDFLDIYRAARARGFVVTLYTNATMATPELCEALAQDPPQEIEVTIYGADAEHYEGTTGIRGSFAKFERGVRLMQDAGLNVVLKHTVSTLSDGHVPAIRAWCEARGLPLKPGTMIENRHSGGQEPSLYRIEPRKVVELRDYLHEARTGAKRAGPTSECSMVPDASAEQLYRCGAGRIAVFVDALGQASHCVLDREPSFPILEMEWDDLWAQMGAWVTQPLPADAPCSGCGLRGGCDNCPARSRLATGSPFLKDSYQCDITHAEHGLPPAAVPAYQPAARPLGACAR
jgi:MoaA/NifB/PqqE/SkfB family radical SAM enzyme